MDKLCELLCDLRESDRAEVACLGDVDSIVTWAYLNSERLYTVRDTSGRLLCIAGVVAYVDVPGGEVWMLGTNELMKNKAVLTKLSRIILDEMLDKYGQLYNCVWAESKASIRWLKYLGATFLGEVKLAGKPFLPFVFERRREDV